MASNSPFQYLLQRFPESYERTRIQPQQQLAPPVLSSPPPSTPPTPHYPLFSTVPNELTPLLSQQSLPTRSPSLGPPPPTPPTPHDPRLDTHEATPTAPPDPTQTLLHSALSSTNFIDLMPTPNSPPSIDFGTFDNHYRSRIAARFSDPSYTIDQIEFVFYRAIRDSLRDLCKHARMKVVKLALQNLDNALHREGKMVKRALKDNTSDLRSCHDSCARETLERDIWKVRRIIGRIWRDAVDDEVELDYNWERKWRKHWKAVRAMMGRSTRTLGWKMKMRQIRAKGKRVASKLRSVRRADAGLEERGVWREARREKSGAQGGDSGYETDDSWTGSSADEPVDEQVEEQVEDEGYEDTTLGWAETDHLL